MCPSPLWWLCSSVLLSQYIQVFMNTTWLERMGVPLESNVILLLWSFTVSAYPLGGLTGAVVAGPMAIMLGRYEVLEITLSFAASLSPRGIRIPTAKYPPWLKIMKIHFSIVDQPAINTLGWQGETTFRKIFSISKLNGEQFFSPLYLLITFQPS